MLLEWRRVLNGRADYGCPALSAADLDRLDRLADAGGGDDRIGWPSAERWVPHYEHKFPAHPLAGQLNGVDTVVSPCRMGRLDVPDVVEHQVIGLIDTDAGDNPNVGFVLADTAAYLVGQVGAGHSVFLHCVQAQNRTPAVAAAYLKRSQGIGTDAALDRVALLTVTRPQSFLIEALRSLEE